MELDGAGDPRVTGCYRAYEGLKAANNGSTASFKRLPNSQTHSLHKPPRGAQPCLCFGGGAQHPDKVRHSLLKSCFLNLAVCTLLLLYTLLGSFVFLHLEGMPAETPHQKTLATTVPGPGLHARNRNGSWFNQINEARAHTVENLWLTTEKLNILYRENWTRLANEEIARFQEQVVKTLSDHLLSAQLHNPPPPQQTATTTTHDATRSGDDVTGKRLVDHEWNFARAFLYSLTVLTTIGYGSVAPHSTLGKLVTMAYALLGIPLTLLYLSSAGSLLSRCARGVFSRALCCCLCSNCGYCCYDERRMQEKERRMKKRRQQEELAQQQHHHHHYQQQQQQQQQQSQHHQQNQQEPFYVRANNAAPLPAEVKRAEVGRHRGVGILAPVCVCLGAMLLYIGAGAFALHRLEGWSLVDASYFCFMSLSTVGFGELLPGSYPKPSADPEARNATVWFCSCYIMSGMALTAMCFNILHDEVLHRLAHRAHGPLRPEQQQPPPPLRADRDEPFAIDS